MSVQANKGATAIVSGGPSGGGGPVPPHAPTHAPASGSDPLATGPAGAIQIGDASATGTADTLARSDHTHAVPVPTVVSQVLFGQLPTPGASTAFAREDHVHELPDPLTLSANQFTGGTAGGSQMAARSDHQHTMFDGPASTVEIGDVQDPGVSANPARSDHVHALPAPALPAAQVPGAGTAGVSTTPARSDHVHPMGEFLSPINGFRITDGNAAPISANTDTGPLQIAFLVPFTGDAITMRTAGGVLYNLRSAAIAIDLAVAPVSTFIGQPHDVFAVDVAGVLTVQRKLWGAANARGYGLSRTDGLIVDNANPTWRYLGTILTGAGGNGARYRWAPYPAAGTPAELGIWNYENRARFGWGFRMAFASWVQNASGVWEGVNTSATGLGCFLIQGSPDFTGAVTAPSTISARLLVSSEEAAGGSRAAAIGYDAVNAPHAQCRYQFSTSILQAAHCAELEMQPTEGSHFIAWIERSQAGLATWFGELANNYSHGMSGNWDA